MYCRNSAETYHKLGWNTDHSAVVRVWGNNNRAGAPDLKSNKILISCVKLCRTLSLLSCGLNVRFIEKDVSVAY